MLTIRFDVAGEPQYVRAFEAYENELRDLSQPLGDIADLLVKAVGEQFQTEGSHGLGSRWTALNTEYDTWKDEHYPGRPMLVLSGAMRQAYLVEGTRELDEQHLVWGVTDQVDPDGERIAPRATGHQTGRGVVPQRKIIALNTMDRREWDRAFVEWLNYLRRSIIGATS